jgi:hypothetical protein
MRDVLATAADQRFGYQLVNLLGSIRANSDVFDSIAVFDLGLDERQRRFLDDVPGVTVDAVPPFVPHWRQGRTWKTWIWTHVDAERLFWLDAGTTVLRSLESALHQVDERDYFVVSQGHPVGDCIPADYYERFSFPRELAARDTIAAGILGFRPGSDFFERVIVPAHQDAVDGFSLGFSPADVRGRNTGLDDMDVPTLRDCTTFRWDQTVLNIRFYLGVEAPVIADLDEYAGWRSPRDHPRQVIWSHRRTGDLPYLSRAPRSLRLRAAGTLYRLRWWRKRHERWFTRTPYVLKARQLRSRRGARRRSSPR